MDFIFKALADPNRRKILEILKTGDMTVQEIAVYFQFSGATLSHHLSLLKRADLVNSIREGQFIRYSLNAKMMEEAERIFSTIFQKDRIA